MGSQHEKILIQVYTATDRPHMKYASNTWSSAARTDLGRLTKAQNSGLRIITGGMKTTLFSEVERTAGLVLLEESGEENSCAKAKRWRGFLHTHYIPSWKLPPKRDLRDRVQTIRSKHFSRNTGSPYQHTTNHWKAGTPTIILDIPGIHAKEHHTYEELRSLTMEALSVAYPSTSWARAYTEWVSRRGSKKWRRWSLHQAPWRQIHQEVCSYRAAVNKLQSWSLRLAYSSPDPEPGRETSYQHSVFDWLPAHLTESSITRRGPELQQHQTGAVPA